MSNIANVFGRPLQPNPAIAIAQPALPSPDAAGPEHKVQFVIEFVGPRSIPAASAVQILGPKWFEALGKPEVFVMASSDRQWTPLTPSTDGSYDSMALAWDLVSERGQLTGQSSTQLFKVAESFASQIQRRAMPLPPPSDVDRAVSTLNEIKDGLDIGVEVLIVPQGREFAERDVWIALSDLGFDLGSSGFFELHGTDRFGPLLTVTPSGGRDSFSLASVHQNVLHPGLLIGFNVPTSPNPPYALEALFKTADHLCTALDGAAFTDEDQALDASARAKLLSYLREGVAALTRVGIVPGSVAARKLFES